MRCMAGVDKQALLAVLLTERALSPGYLRALFGGSRVESDGQRENSGANCLPHTWHMVGAQDMSATAFITKSNHCAHGWEGQASDRAGRGLLLKPGMQRPWESGGPRGTGQVFDLSEPPFPYLCKTGSIALPVSVDLVRGQEIIHPTAAEHSTWHSVGAQ